MGARFDRLRYEVFQNLFLSPMNTGFVRPAIAIVLTACGIETADLFGDLSPLIALIAIVLTACGIETLKDIEQARRNYSPNCNSTYRLRY